MSQSLWHSIPTSSLNILSSHVITGRKVSYLERGYIPLWENLVCCYNCSVLFGVDFLRYLVYTLHFISHIGKIIDRLFPPWLQASTRDLETYPPRIRGHHRINEAGVWALSVTELCEQLVCGQTDQDSDLQTLSGSAWVKAELGARLCAMALLSAVLMWCLLGGERFGATPASSIVWFGKLGALSSLRLMVTERVKIISYVLL